MRLFVPTPTDEPLPLAHAREYMPDPAGLPLRSAAVAQFDALLHELNPDAVRVDPERVQGLCVWLASLPSLAAQEVLDRRLRRIEDLRAMLDDADWDANEATRMRLRKLIAYIDQDDDLIPDHDPVLGKLDDVLLIELAWPAFADEADDYRDFSEYRSVEHPGGNGSDQRAAWIRDRLAEIALLQHHLRVNSSHYVDRGRSIEPFHVV
jgi:uncharacterized membrane protein YkvA (DUF1232 family)